MDGMRRKQSKVSIADSLYMRFLYVELKMPVSRIMKKFPKYSRATVFRHVKRPLNRPHDKRKLNPGRPRRLTPRDERNLIRHIKRMRSTIGPFTLRRLAVEAGIDQTVSMATVGRVMRRHGYRYLHSRRKGIMKNTDLHKRLAFARNARKLPKNFWMKHINFYLDGTGFTHKTNPHDEARSTKTMAWRRRAEGLSGQCTTKGKRAGTGGRMSNFMVAICPNRGVVFCRQYHDRWNGDSFAKMVREEFPAIYQSTRHIRGKAFLQDGCPVQNSAKAKKAIKDIGAEVFSIPPRSPDLNPIENFFNLVSRKLSQDALDNRITKESFNEFSGRVKATIENFDAGMIDRIIGSMPKRLDKIIKRRGGRLRY